MITGTVESKARWLALMEMFFIAVVLMLWAGLQPQGARAATSDVQYQQFITTLCGAGPPPGSTWDLVKVGLMCGATGGGASGGVTPSVNLGTGNAGGNVESRRKKGIRESLDEQSDKPAKGASADGGGWGLLITPQYGNNNRAETDRENGYQSDLRGLVIGLDYRFSDSFVIGSTIGQTKNHASFLNNAGSLKTRNNSITLYSTWLPTDSTSIDGYLGYGRLRLDSLRSIVYGSISGSASGNTSGHQVMGGLSASFTRGFGSLSLSPYISLDSIRTTFDGYNETGTTLFELHFSERTALSTSSSLGVRMNFSKGYDWGTLLPSAQLAAVHEYQNNSKQISNELVITPGAGFVVQTDSPDRNYLNLGLGVAAALNSGAQLFFDYEKRAQDKLLSSWSVSLGGLFEF